MYQSYFKRPLDILISLMALPFVLLEVILLAPVIYLTDKGPVFYNAPRVGKDGKVFTMYKLRTMRVNSPDLKNADGSTYNGEDDPRVTRVGRILRRLSLDEFPQFLNVLKGDMSIIGPRAHLAGNFRGLDRLDDAGRRRLLVRPGITGYNQAYYRNSVSTRQKIANDVYYVDHLSFALDVKIIFATVASVLSGKNVYAGEASRQPAGEGKESQK